jgi:hypothetical protein
MGKVPVIVRITQIATGETREHADCLEDGNPYMWSDGNFSCDCNREIFFRQSRGEDEIDNSCGETRYGVRIVNVATGAIIYDESAGRDVG